MWALQLMYFLFLYLFSPLVLFRWLLVAPQSPFEQVNLVVGINHSLKIKYSRAKLSHKGKQIDNRCVFVAEPLSHAGKPNATESTRQPSKQ